MRLELTGRHLEVSPALRRLVEMKLKRIERLLSDSAISTQVVLTREKDGMHADITLHARGEKFLHGVGRGEAWGPSLVQAVDKIARQARTVKGKWVDRKRQSARPNVEAELIDRSRPMAVARVVSSPARTPPAFRMVRQTMTAMSIPAAIRQLGKQRTDLVVFREAERGLVNVLYRSHDGQLTLIETE
jgi:putative sigma-54 modulation protein